MNNLTERRNAIKSKKGFTLIELIVVIVIIGILAAILIPRFTGFTDRAKTTDAVIKAKQVATAADSIYAEYSAWGTAASAAAISGVAASAISDYSNGAFVVTVTVGGVTYQAQRTSSVAGVEAIPK